jgi:hypothetical protein
MSQFEIAFCHLGLSNPHQRHCGLSKHHHISNITSAIDSADSHEIIKISIKAQLEFDPDFKTIVALNTLSNAFYSSREIVQEIASYFTSKILTQTTKTHATAKQISVHRDNFL